MSQFDVHRLGDGLVLNCQSDLLQQINSRLVVPLILKTQVPQLAERLNPVFNIGGEDRVMLTQAAAAVRLRELGEVVTSLAERSFEITAALDVLISGV